MQKAVACDEGAVGNASPAGLVSLATGRAYAFPQREEIRLRDISSVRKRVWDVIEQAQNEGHLPEQPTLSQIIDVCMQCAATRCEVAMEALPLESMTGCDVLVVMREHFLS